MVVLVKVIWGKSAYMWIHISCLCGALALSSPIEEHEALNATEGDGAYSEYRRKYSISIPEPLVCFPGFEDKVLQSQNKTLLEDIYSFKIIKPADVVHAVSLAPLNLPVYLSLKILYVLMRYADTIWLPSFDQNLVDAKIEASVARSEIAHLRAKLETIYNRLSTINDDQYPEDIKKAELVVAVDKAEEILSGFRDKNFIFMKNPAATLPFLVLFSGPCKILLDVACVLVPSKVAVYEAQLELLNNTVEDYKFKTVGARLDGLIFDKVKTYPNVTSFAKNLWNHWAWSYDYSIKLLDPLGGWGPCHNVQNAETYSDSEADIIMDNFLEEYKSQLTKAYNAFFSRPGDVFRNQECKPRCEAGGGVGRASKSRSLSIGLIASSLLLSFWFRI